ncbi:MAG: hypothetical protein QHH27_10035, partial [Clostridia bacterium]|nr:hypothetical protein [Clostridia bacterium]
MQRWCRNLVSWIALLALVVPAGWGGARAAVAADADVSAYITSPTRSDPASVEPGDSVRVTFRYEADEDAWVEVALIDAEGEELAVEELELVETSTTRSKSVTLEVPSYAEPGACRVVLRLADGTVLDTERNAVLVTEDVSV